ncbi:hypothetical protein [Flavobacterium sp. NRK F7]|uniref:hypothetical protein n=1 Tax=Flavobacterium sp. NRK F7 TaxID=2954930 RepID=UPI0020905C07|nr:hypothetical protein [Flavobacterium sp. NRK F7]MCO6162330.1 hypothetical protein [Flavobacterium sp. NRK F7]
MKKLFLNKLHLVLALVVFSLVSCEKENDDITLDQEQATATVETLKAALVAPTSQELPKAVGDQINDSKANLALYANSGIEIAEVKVLGTISSEATLNLSKEVVSGSESVVASGDLTQPNSITTGKLKNVYTGNELVEVQRNIQEVVTNEVNVNDQVLEITWNIQNQKVKTLCFYNNDGIVWDNVIGGLIISTDVTIDDSESFDTQSRLSSRWRSLTWTANWLWGSKRGEMGAKITIYYSGSTVSSTDRSDWAYISLGKAKSESKTTKNSGSYGKIQYALGLCTPVGSLSFNSSNFTVSFSGLGSNVVANGTITLYP